MKINFKIVLGFLCLSLVLKSQNSGLTDPAKKKRCGTEIPPVEWDFWFNKKVQEYKENKVFSKTQNVSITIPVIVHVIHPGSTINTYPNLSVAQIRSQIDVLNKDFAGIGYNAYQLAQTGFSVVGAANTHITFCLAQYDPSGNLLAEPGINRINYNTMGWTNPATPNNVTAFRSLMENTIKPASIWDPTAYLNIWVSDVNFNVDILGYATFPGGANLAGLTSNIGTAGNDGIWVWARCFGNTGTLQAPYNLGRTATHEIGHWLGLRHIGGDGNNNPAGDCNATDYCEDTPPQKGGNAGGGFGQNYGAPIYPFNANVCGSPYGDMFMNFMDYTDDAALYMFTPDQNTRMQTALVDGYFRNQLGSSSFTLCAGMPLADFINDTIGCINSGISPFNTTDQLTSHTYSWSVKPSAGVTFSPGSQDASPNINFPSTGTYSVLMVATNSLGVSSHSLTLRIEDCTSLDKNESFSAGLSLSPNPGNGKYQIHSKNTLLPHLTFSVYNALGQLIVAPMQILNTQQAELDMTAFPEGIYTLSLSNGRQHCVKKLILSR